MTTSFTLLIKLLNTDPSDVPITELFYKTQFFWLILLLVAPLITMRSFAAEKHSGTYETLMTTPVSDLAVVLAKFTSVMIFYTLLWLPTLLYIPMLTDLHATWDENGLTSHCGRFLGGLGLVAIGILMMPAGWVGRGFVLAIIGTIVAVPLGLATAIYLSEYASQRVRRVARLSEFCSEGEADYLSLSIWRAVADGPVRSKADADEV